MKKIYFVFAIIFLTLSFLFIFKNDALGAKFCGDGPPCDEGYFCKGGNCVLTNPEDGCINDSDCAAHERCSSNGRCVPRGGGCDSNNWGGCSVACGGGTQTNGCGDSQGCNTHACPTAIPIPTATPVPQPTATPAPACSKKSQGDADCDGHVTLKDYFYYVAKKAGATLPTTVNVDFDGDGKVNASDRVIIIKSLKP